jgi:hypothetical protein
MAASMDYPTEFYMVSGKKAFENELKKKNHKTIHS